MWQSVHTPLGVSGGVLLWGGGPQRGLGPMKAEESCCVAGILEKMGEESQTPTPGTPNAEWVGGWGEGSTQYERGARVLGCPRSERSGVWGECVQRGVWKQGCRAKARTERKPRSLVPQRPLVPLDKAVPTFKVGWTGGQHHPHRQVLPWVQPEPPGTGQASLPRGHPAEGSFGQRGPESFPPYQGALQGLVPQGSQLRVSHL